MQKDLETLITICSNALFRQIRVKNSQEKRMCCFFFNFSTDLLNDSIFNEKYICFAGFGFSWILFMLTRFSSVSNFVNFKLKTHRSARFEQVVQCEKETWENLSVDLKMNYCESSQQFILLLSLSIIIMMNFFKTYLKHIIFS